MAIAAALGVLLLIIVQIFFWIQLTEVGIHVLNPAGEGFMATGSPFAWIVVFILIAISAFLIRFIFRWINILVVAALGLFFNLFSRDRQSRYNLQESVLGAYLLIWISWAIGCLYLTAGTMAHFAANPQLNSWLAEGSWIAHVLVYLGIFGMVCPSARSED